MIVLDSSAIIAHLANEPGGSTISRLLEDNTLAGTIHAHAINLCEVFYQYSRVTDVIQARGFLEALEQDGIIRCEDMDAAFCEDAGQIKAQWKRISMADCFGLALARRLDADFYTADRHELEILLRANVAKIRFIR